MQDAQRHLVVENLWDGQPAGDGERLHLGLAQEAAGVSLNVDAPFHGDPPPPPPAGPCWGLWEHEVVEVFVLGPGEDYTEIELGPHGHYLVLRLAGRREPVACSFLDGFRPIIAAGRWHAELRIPAELLPRAPHRYNVYAIHGQGEARRHLALWAVPGTAPDFHRLECFRPLDQVPARMR